MAVDKNGYCWVGYLSGVIVKANVDGRSDYNLANPIKTQNSVNAIHIDKEGNTWFASGYSGLVKYDSVNWISYKTTASGLPSNTVGSITIDNNGDKWIGSDDGGVAKFDNTVWSKFDTANHIIPSNKIIAIAVDKKNKKWIAAGSGYIYQYNDTSWKIIQYPDNLNGLVIDEAQNKWIATYSNGLLKYDGTTWIKYYPPFSGTIPPGVYCMVIDRQGEIWGRIYTQSTGYNPGLGRFNGTDWTIFSQANSDLPENYFTHIAVSKNNNKWITGGQNPFLVEFDGAKWIRYDSSNFNLPSFKISSIAFEENGNMWIATESGLCKFDGNIIKIFNTGNSGIPLDKVLNISIDAKGNKWIGTSGGGLAVFREGGVILNAEKNPETVFDKDFLLYQNYPNPFNPVTKIDYRVPENCVVTLKVFDVLGKEVATLVNEVQSAGKYSLMFNGANLPSGIYFYRLQAGQYSEVKKLALVK
ncbi:MAG: T9SS type A sorting domain-containing protein [Ignavibacteriales bacterium]|nr:T9SS type A sorting domain-containing protein [Ignavibacteriales bacterium]